MNQFSKDFYTYHNNELYCEEVRLSDIAEKYGTPVYVYSKKSMLKRLKAFREAFKDLNHKVFYAVKSNSNINIIRLFHEEGCGFDVNSLGEMTRALKAGVPAKDMIMSGVAKSDTDILEALKAGVAILKAESKQEIEVINDFAGELRMVQEVALRVNPDIIVPTHPHISTAASGNKFGIDAQAALQIYNDAHLFENIKFTGIDVHLGSHIFDTLPYVTVIRKLRDYIEQIEKGGVFIKHIDLGGGYGVSYTGGDDFPFEQLSSELKTLFPENERTIFFEPGRYLTANSGVLLCKVLFTKRNGPKDIVLIDGSMSELIRPALYGAHHEIFNNTVSPDEEKMVYDIAGPVCESTDYLAKDRKLWPVERGDYLSIMSAGSYGYVMSSNYNTRPKPYEILVNGSTFSVIKQRETYETLLSGEYTV